MILLRIRIADAMQEIRSEQASVVLGSDPTADITLQTAGWAPRAARLVVTGVGVRVDVPGAEPTRLRVGDRYQLGSAEIELAGLTLPDAAAGDAAGMPDFGDYADEGADTPKTFALEDGPAGLPRADSSAPAPRQETGTVAAAGAAPASARNAGTAGDRSAKPSSGTAAAQAKAGGRASQDPKGQASKGSVAKGNVAKDRVAKKKGAKAAGAAAGITLSDEERERLMATLRGQQDLGTALVEQLRRSPFFVLSAAMHVLVLLLLSILITDKPGQPTGTGEGMLMAEFAKEDETAESFESETPPRSEIDATDELVLPDTIDPMDLLDPRPEESPQDGEPILEDIDDPMLDPPDMGLMPSRPSLRRKRPQRTKRPDKRTLEVKFQGDQAARDVNSRASQIVRDMTMGPGKGPLQGRVPQKSELLVVDGRYDSMENVLEHLSIPYTRVTKDALASPNFRLDRAKAIFWNCGDPMTNRRAHIAMIQRLRRWIADGGYLFSTDWGIAQVVAPAFPGLIQTTAAVGAFSEELVLHVEPSRIGRSHPLMDGVFLRGARGQWWLEKAAFDIVIKDRAQVQVLIECPYLERTLRRDPAVAVTFEHGRGRVLHVIGHYYQKAGNLAGTIASQRLALNFLMLRNQQR